MVMVTSLLAAAALFTVFFAGLAIAPKGRVGRTIGALAAAGAAGLAWTAVVVLARARGWVLTEEAQFHHLYVLGAVGLPIVGAAVFVASLLRPVKDRRARIGGRLVALAFIAPAFIGFYATNIEPHWLQVEHLTVGGGGVRVAVVSDIQTDRFGDFENAALEAALAEQPDVIVVPGDVTQVPLAEYDALADDAAVALNALEAPGGVFLVSGNTDPSITSIEEVADAAGITSLSDEVAEVTVGGQRLRLLGLSWPNNRRAAVVDALAEFAQGSSDETIDIVLAHSPDVIFNVANGDGIDLIITGHTHGGQIQLPFYGPVWNVTELPREVAAGGLHEVRDVPVYVSPGIGVQRGESPKVRFGVRPTIGILDVG